MEFLKQFLSEHDKIDLQGDSHDFQNKLVVH